MHTRWVAQFSALLLCAHSNPSAGLTKDRYSDVSLSGIDVSHFQGDIDWEKEAMKDLTPYRLWIADSVKEPAVPEGWAHWTFWQHREDGSVDGINANVSLTTFTGDEAKLEETTCEADQKNSR